MAQDRTTPIASRLAGRIRRARGNPAKLSAAWAEWARACLPLNAPPRVNAHPTHAVVDGVTYPGGLAEYVATTGHNPATPVYLAPSPE